MRATRNIYPPLNTTTTIISLTDEELKNAYDNEEQFYDLVSKVLELADNPKVFTVKIPQFSRRFLR